jgi:hypothetical protein
MQAPSGREGCPWPSAGLGQAGAEFRATVIAYATDFDDTRVMAAKHFTRKKGPVGPAIDHEDTIYWSCSRCKVRGRIFHWQGKLWDLTERGELHS